MSHTARNTGNTKTRRSRGDPRPAGAQLYKGAYMVPVSKEWVFRQRTKKDGTPGSQTELLEANPEVTRIWVDKRENSQPSEQGDLLRVEISGKNKEAVETCYAEGRQKILDSMAYDRKKLEAKQANKQRYQQRRQRPNFDEDRPYTDEIQAGDCALMQSFKLAHQKAKSKKKSSGAGASEAAAAAEDVEQEQRIKKANPFGALLNGEDEYEQAQARRNAGKNRRARRDEARAAQPKSVADMFADAPALPSAPRAVLEGPKVSTGWAKMAAKPKKVEVVKKEEPMVRFVTLAPKKSSLAKPVHSEALWEQDDELPLPREMTWNQATVDTGGDGWDDWD